MIVIPFARSSLTGLQTQALNDIAAALPTGVPLTNSILSILAMTMAGFSHGHYGYLDWIAQQSVPFTATDEFLEAWAALKGIIRVAATNASGTATLTGLFDSSIPVGTLLRRGDGVQYSVTTTTAIPGSLTATVPIQAVEAGAAGNAAAGIILTLTSPIAGVTSTGVSAAVITGGADAEDDDTLRTRMNQKYAAPPQGGAASDYVTWAYTVPGVTRAWCLPNGGGPGSVTVYAMLDAAQAAHGGFPQGTNGVAGLELRDIAATGDQRTIADAIYPLRPATAMVYVAAPKTQTVNVTLANLAPDTPTLRTAIGAAVADLFLRVGTPLGGTVYPSDLNAAIEGTAGISRYTLVTPVAPVTTPIGFLPVFGTLTVS